MVFTFFFFTVLSLYFSLLFLYSLVIKLLLNCKKTNKKKKRLDNQINADRLIPEIPNFHFSL